MRYIPFLMMALLLNACGDNAVKSRSWLSNSRVTGESAEVTQDEVGSDGNALIGNKK